MKFSYIAVLNGVEIRQECTYHTCEAQKDGGKKLVFPRFHHDGGLLTLDLVALQDPGTGVYRCQLEIHNTGSQPVRLSRADVGVSFESRETTVHFFQSDWGSEYSPRSQKIESEFSFGCVSGRSCKGFTPYVECETDSGYYAMALAWSGNWTCTTFPWAESYCDFRQWTTCCVMGLTDGEFYYDIPGGGAFTTPAVYLAAAQSREPACLALRRYYKKFLSPMDEKMFIPMPLEYNTWWPYEDRYINEEVYQQNAEIAQKMGFRYAMLDAGWFGETVEGETWFEKRGDWDKVNPELFPSGMKAMCDKAKAVGILPGMWCEIEAVGKDAELNKTHEKIIAKREERSLGYVCFGSKEGRKWAMDTVDRILGEYGAKWIKFDFNLDPGFGCDREDHDHGKGDGLYAHYLGYYQFLDELREKYPDVVIENCSSGGLRGDIGMMSHCQVGFLSDPDFTEFHLQLYWGALSFLHQCCLLHFTWSDVLQDHNLGVGCPIQEDTPQSKLDYMVRAAMMGLPGFSYRLPELPAWALERIQELGEFYTQHSTAFLLQGDAYRLTEQPLTFGRGERFPVFQFVDKDQRGLVFAFRLPGAKESQTVRLQGLDPQRTYQVAYQDSGDTWEATGAQLMEQGLTLQGLPEEGSEIVTVF